MINFDGQYFQKVKFSNEQLDKFINSAERDFNTADQSDNPDVIFRFCYDALIKIGIYVIADYGYKVRSQPGHHVKIIEKLGQALKNEDILIYGDKMRKERNVGLYSGGFEVSDKDSHEYLELIRRLLTQVKSRSKK